MPDVTPIIVAVIAAAGSIGTALVTVRRLGSKQARPSTDDEALRLATERAELWEAKAAMITDELAETKVELAAVRELQRVERIAADATSRQLDDCRSDFRALERRRRPRPSA